MAIDVLKLLARIQVDTTQAEREIENFNRRFSSGMKGAGEGTDKLASSLGKLEQGLGAVGIGFGAIELGQFGIEALNAANNLDKTEATVRALSGSTARYAQVLQLAKGGQDAYGGSLQQNLTALGQFVNLSNRSGVELEKLDNVARRLAQASPEQGLEGAAFAMKEFLNSSGAESILSLSDRFEIPKAALREFTAEGVTAAEKIAALDVALNDLGFSNETLAASTQTTANTYDRLGSAFDNAKVAIGGFIADSLVPLAEKSVEAFKAVASGVKELQSVGDKMTALNGQLVAGAGSYEQYAAQANNAAGQLASAGQIFPVLNEASYNYAQSLIAQGEAADVAAGKALAMGQALYEVDAVQRALTQEGDESKDAIADLGATMAKVAGSNKANEATVIALAKAYRGNKIDAEQLREAINQMDRALGINANREAEAARISYMYSGAKQNSKNAVQQHTQALQQNAAKNLLAAANTQELSLHEQILAQQARTTALALLQSGNVGAAQAARLAGSSSQVDQLTAAYYRLGVSAQQAANLAITAMRVAASVAPQFRSILPGFEAAVKGMATGVATGKPQDIGLVAVEPPKKPRGGAGGGDTRAKEEERVQEELAAIAERGGERLAEIDRRIAEERAEAYRQLAADILTTSADLVAQQEANDLELVGLDEERLRAAIPREQAESDARKRAAEAAQEAQRIAAEGDAELAQKTYDIRMQSVQDRQQLDEEYYKKQAELADNPEQLAVLDQQYKEAIDAQQTAVDVRLDLARKQAEQAAQAAQEEKASVVREAQEQAAKVKGASETQRTAVVTSLDAQSRAASNWASSVATAAGRVVDAAHRAAGAIRDMPALPGGGSGGTGASTGSSGGGGSPTKAAGGGTFIAHRPMTLTVGDAPDPELITVTPLGRKGQTVAGAGWVRMAGGGAILDPSDATNPALQLLAGGGSSSGKTGRDVAETVAQVGEAISDFNRDLELDLVKLRRNRELKRQAQAEEDAIDARREAAQAKIEERLRVAASQAKLEDDLQQLREERALSRTQKAREDALDRQREARVQELVNAERTRRTVAVEAERNAALARVQQTYTTQALGIVKQYGQSSNELQNFWARAQVADLQANFQEQRQAIVAEYGKQADTVSQEAEEAAKKQAEAEFQARYDALEEQNFREQRLLDNAQSDRADAIKQAQKTAIDNISRLLDDAFQAEYDRAEEVQLIRKAYIDEELKNLKDSMTSTPLVNSLTGGSGSGDFGTITLQVDARGATNPRDIEAAVQRAVNAALKELGKRAYQLRVTGI